MIFCRFDKSLQLICLTRELMSNNHQFPLKQTTKLNCQWKTQNHYNTHFVKYCGRIGLYFTWAIHILRDISCRFVPFSNSELMGGQEQFIFSVYPFSICFYLFYPVSPNLIHFLWYVWLRVAKTHTTYLQQNSFC